MTPQQLIKDYFKLNEEDKNLVLVDLIGNYFDINLAKGLTVEEIVLGIDFVIERTNEDENYELSQAFLDIKNEIKKLIDTKNGRM